MIVVVAYALLYGALFFNYGANLQDRHKVSKAWLDVFGVSVLGALVVTLSFLAEIYQYNSPPLFMIVVLAIRFFWVPLIGIPIVFTMIGYLVAHLFAKFGRRWELRTAWVMPGLILLVVVAMLGSADFASPDAAEPDVADDRFEFVLGH